MSPVGQLEFILCLMLAVLALALVARRLDLPPAAAFILGGGVLALVPGVPALELNPELVLVLFLPPLLMSGAYFTVWREFRANVAGILLLAVGAVVFTTLLVGVVTHWLLPGLPWAVCFALGAIVSPPDAVAAEAVLERLQLPSRVTALLQGESLLNDAAGLVLFRFAVAAALTGSFSIGDGAVTFGLLAVGGVAVGLAVGWVGMAVLRRLDDTQLAITTTLLLPWASYIGGEHLHVSGVLATVACGMLLGWHQHADLSAGTRIRAHAFWQVLVFILESLVFILIGLSLRGVLSRLGSAAEATEALLLPVAAVVATVILSRFVWVFGSDLLRRLFRRWRPGSGPAPSFAVATVMSWAGMRGVVSLAAALALPEELPGRDFVLVATFGVILVTVLVQGGTLGPLIRRLGLDGAEERDPSQLPEEVAWSRVAQAQLAVVAAASRQEDGTERHPRLLEQYGYRARISVNYAANRDIYRPDEIAHFTVVLQAIQAGRAEILRMHRAGEIHDHVLAALEQELDLQQMVAELSRG
ncbi:Na+/H+ antiporter [Roseomonas sp. BN140053]|uniref:Na+/H+ antiporter n=1 Tax=Roseomonas sp. BN140053 TaxID=3391898 RepID=UPI0039E79CB4